MSLSTNTGICPVCELPVTETCILERHTSRTWDAALEPSEHNTELPTNITNPQPPIRSPGSDIPRCPGCRGTIHPLCLLHQHIMPCKTCGMSYKYTAKEGDKLATYVNWEHTKALQWLKEREDVMRPRNAARTPSRDATTPPIGPLHVVNNNHPCLAHRIHNESGRYARYIPAVSIDSASEYGKALESLRQQHTYENARFAAILALRVLKAECDANKAAWTLIEMSARNNLQNNRKDEGEGGEEN